MFRILCPNLGASDFGRQPVLRNWFVLKDLEIIPRKMFKTLKIVNLKTQLLAYLKAN